MRPHCLLKSAFDLDWFNLSSFRFKKQKKFCWPVDHVAVLYWDYVMVVGIRIYLKCGSCVLKFMIATTSHLFHQPSNKLPREWCFAWNLIQSRNRLGEETSHAKWQLTSQLMTLFWPSYCFLCEPPTWSYHCYCHTYLPLMPTLTYILPYPLKGWNPRTCRVFIPLT